MMSRHNTATFCVIYLNPSPSTTTTTTNTNTTNTTSHLRLCFLPATQWVTFRPHVVMQQHTASQAERLQARQGKAREAEQERRRQGGRKKQGEDGMVLEKWNSNVRRKERRKGRRRREVLEGVKIER
ncbi:hypothetical protein E2C01_072125 [Portunus trituberculatus]|uniref:Uncharacterized protein n=1 Tax=Portunus trituberculatus TaxID=210409 RepID=A0A5B7I6Y1_PORTR|nr:hypothetical protein [Portunus trituberculatus]